MKRIKKALQKGLCMITLAALCVATIGSVSVMAAETNEIEMEMEDINTSSQVGILNHSVPNGEVVGYGVCLRAAASSSARILALMYPGEEVIIDESQSIVNSNGAWYYLKHVRTGKWGYASAYYIACWNA